MEFYVDEKQHRKRRQIFKLKIYIGLAVFLLLLVGVFYAVVYSPLFRITRINADVNIEELKNFFSSRSKIAKFLGRDNILIWNNNVGDFLKQNPQIMNLSVEKNYFRREVKVDFQKRERFGIWCQQNEICWWFDKNGVVFEHAPKTEGEMIYKVDDFSERRLIIGNKIIKEDLLANLLKIFNILEQSGLNVRTLQIKDLSLQEATVEPVNILMPKIYFSLRFDPAFAMPAIQAIKEYGLNKIEYVDFRVENRAYYKIK
ncbi:MAG: hypothetical protein AAB504_01300 [Patescibacteria group bacterium]